MLKLLGASSDNISDKSLTGRLILDFLRPLSSKHDIHRALFEALIELGPPAVDILDSQFLSGENKTVDSRFYGNFWRDARLEIDQFKSSWNQDSKPIMLDVGGGNGEVQGFRKGFTYIIMDINPRNETGSEIVHDLNMPMPIDDSSIDVVFSNQVLEHLHTPWRTVSEIGRILKPNGLCLLSTVFSYRVHGYPNDYFRFTHAGLESLFVSLGGLEKKICKYELTHRREDRREPLNSEMTTHVDWLGGFRENWFVYFIGRKP